MPVVNTALSITQLRVENVKRIQVATINPKGKMIVIGGDNEQGKTSLLDSIEYALHGKKSLPAEPLRRGQKKGRVEVDLGDLKVERRFTKKDSTLVVTAKDGTPYSSPQSVLDKLYTDHTFDALGFVNLKPKDQLEMMRQIAGVNFKELDEKRQQLYTERTGIGREISSLEGQIATIEPEEVSPVETGELLTQIEQAENHNASGYRYQADLTAAKALVERDTEEIESLKVRLKTATERRNLSAARVVEIEEEIADFEVKDVEPLKDQLRRAGEINAKVQDQSYRKAREKQLRGKNADREKLTLAIEDIDAEKERQLAAIKFPVDGLAFGDEGILFNGLPFEQASGEQQLVVSAAMALAQNPKLRILLIRNGSLLDEKHLTVLTEWAVENEVQVWLERVSKGKEVSVIIENGLVEGAEDDEGSTN